MILSTGITWYLPVPWIPAPSSLRAITSYLKPSTLSLPSTPTGDANHWNWTPSARASSYSDNKAGICSWLRRYATVTDSQPRRTHVRAASIAPLPPPMITTRSPFFTGIAFSSSSPFSTNCTFVNKYIAWNTPVIWSFSIRTSWGICVPVPMKMVSKPSANRSSKDLSWPMNVLHTNLTPKPSRRAISRRTTDLDKRNSGIPNKSTPPGSDWPSNTVTS